jgi:sec-independent protein translocase protein TatC
VLPPQPAPAAPGGDGPPGGRGKRRRPPREPEDRPMSVVEHLDELRRRLLWMIGALLVGVAAGFAFVKPMLEYLEAPLHGLKLYITAPLDPLFAFVKISVAFGLVVASPVILYQMVAYVLPALTRAERRLLFTYLPVATALFVAGMAFGFYVFIPLVLDAMVRFTGTALTPILTIDKYISFLLSFTLPFGAIFELPVAVVTLVRLGVLTPQTLVAGRRWALMITVVIAAIFAPPDPITPLVMALPIYGLYEASIWVARFAARRPRAE